MQYGCLLWVFFPFSLCPVVKQVSITIHDATFPISLILTDEWLWLKNNGATIDQPQKGIKGPDSF